MQLLRYVGISIVGLLAGAAAGCVGGLLLSGLLALGYHRHGASDLGDAPVYVAMGLMLIGAFLGAITGVVVAVVYGVRMTRRNKRTCDLQHVN
jgi:ABC-type antimicrobial peptide transport system permease subunit